MKNNLKPEHKKAKTSTLFFVGCILLIIALVFYAVITKFNVGALNLSEYLKHPDKIPQKQVEENKILKEEAKAIEPKIEQIEINQIPEVQIVQEVSYFKVNYRILLQDVSLLLINFFQDKPYTEHINNIYQVYKTLGNREISNIIKNLIEYNESYLVNIPSLKKSVINNQSSIVGKFVKIEKETDALKNKEALKQKIIPTLKKLVEFTYSQEVQNLFINNLLENE